MKLQLDRRVWSGVLAAVFMAGFLSTMWMVFFVPVYGDEPAWKLIGARLFVDAGKLLYLYPQCDTGQWIDIPVTWYPARVIDTLIYQDASNPWFLRTVGWSLFCGLLVGWTAILHITSRLSIMNSGLFVAAFFSFGVMPFLMVFNRPEQSLLLWLTIAFFVMFWFDKHRVTGVMAKIALTVFFALLACLVAATHPKGLFFFPVILLAWWRPVKSPALMLPLLAVMAWSALDTTHVWQMRTACAESPWLTKIFQSLSLQPQQLFKDPRGFFDAGQANLLAFRSYVENIQFKDEYQSAWLPDTPKVSSSFVTGVLINALTWLPLLAVLIFVVLNLTLQAIRQQVGWWSITFMLTLSLTSLVFMQSNKNFYEAGIVLPILLLICVFSFAPSGEVPNRLLTQVLLPLMMVGGTLSSYTRYDLFWSHTQAWRTERANGPADITKLRTFAMDQCKISATSENLVLDLSTYHAFWQHRRPSFIPFFAGWWATGTKFEETLAKQSSGGMVTACHGLPAGLAAFTKQQSGYCCASAADLKQFSRP